MNLKTYIKLLFHAIVVTLIVLSAPIISCILLYDKVADWVTIVASVSSSSVTIFFGIKYMEFLVNKDDLFEDMF